MISATRLKYLQQQLPAYKVRFAKTEADAKKILAHCRKQEGRGSYTNPILENFYETFDSGLMFFISNNKARSLSRYSMLHSKDINHKCFEEEVVIFKDQNPRYMLTTEESRWLLQTNEDNLHDAIGQALLKL